MSNDDFLSKDSGGEGPPFGRMESVDYLLFDSLVYHMIEKGLLTKNDAMSVVQSVAMIVRGYSQDEQLATDAGVALSLLERTYASYEAIPDRASLPPSGDNVRHLRPPVHGDMPRFPGED